MLDLIVDGTVQHYLRERAMMLASDFGSGQVFLSILWFTLFFIWIWLLILVFSDIFRSHDLGGWGKAIWTIFVIVLPYLGVFVYLIARGHKMHEHAVESAQEMDAAQRAYIRQTVGESPSAADELTRIADLKARGVIDDAEFQKLKAKAING
jgi:magnesium-transporting ATPase (P-type)